MLYWLTSTLPFQCSIIIFVALLWILSNLSNYVWNLRNLSKSLKRRKLALSNFGKLPILLTSWNITILIWLHDVLILLYKNSSCRTFWTTDLLLTTSWIIATLKINCKMQKWRKNKINNPSIYLLGPTNLSGKMLPRKDT